MTDSVQQAAQRIIANMKKAYSGPLTYRDVREADFRHLDLNAFAAFQAQHEARGFRHLRDVEIAEISDSPTTLIARTFIRSMVSADGSIVADYYQVKPRMGRLFRLTLRGLMNGRWLDTPRFFFKTLKTRHCIGYESELSNDHFITTSNAETAGMISLPPTIDCQFHAYDTVPAVLALQHVKRLKASLAAQADVQARPVRTVEDLMQMQMRLKQQKDAHRATLNWVTESELKDMSSGNPKLAEAIYSEVQRQLQAGN